MAWSFENAGYIHQDIKAVNIEVARLEADKIGVSELDAVNANIANLQANKVDTEELTAINASIASLQAGKADIADSDCCACWIFRRIRGWLW